MNYKRLPESAGIYMILNLVNGRFYIGQSVNMRKRVREHFTYSGGETGIDFEDDFEVYGKASFECFILTDHPGASSKELKAYEYYWFWKVNCHKNKLIYNVHFFSNKKGIVFTKDDFYNINGELFMPIEHIQKMMDVRKNNLKDKFDLAVKQYQAETSSTELKRIAYNIKSISYTEWLRNHPDLKKYFNNTIYELGIRER